MDPVSIIMITNASFAIARSLIHTIKELYEVAEAYETAATGIKTVATQCTSFRIAIDRISKWLSTQNEDSKDNLDEDFWQALKSNLDTGTLVIEDLDRRIQGLKKSPTRWRTRTKYLWNNVVISDLQGQIQSLISALGLLLTVMNLPNPNAKRSLSRAQSTKLNELTQTARRRYDSRRVRGDRLTEEILASEADQSSLGEDPTPAPPPYVTSPEITPVLADDTNVTLSSTRELVPQIIAQRTSIANSVDVEVDDASKATKRKGSRPSWMRFKRSSNKQQKSQSSADDVSVPVVSNEETDLTPNTILEPSEDRIQATPAPLDTSERNDDYFKSKAAENNVADPINPTLQPVRSPEPEEDASLAPSNPYLALRLGRTRSEIDFANMPRSTYELTRVPSETSSELFDRIRPAQRVLVEQERSIGQGLSTKQSSSLPTSPLSDSILPTPLSRLGTFSSNFSHGISQQKWFTTAINNRRIEFKVKFDIETFTNKMSASAARALGVDEAIFVFEQTPLVQLTLLHTVTDGISEEDSIVNGDEVEFVVMDEYESRIPQLNLGAGFAHLAHLMSAGEFVYWNPGRVPESLRTVDKLRLYKRFELTMW